MISRSISYVYPGPLVLISREVPIRQQLQEYLVSYFFSTVGRLSDCLEVLASLLPLLRITFDVIAPIGCREVGVHEFLEQAAKFGPLLFQH